MKHADNLIESIKNLYNNYGVRLINMSLGPVDPYYQVKKTVQNLNDSYFGSIGSKYYDFDVKIKIYPKDIKELDAFIQNFSKSNHLLHI
nr:hypothetical protein [Mycoplasmopsis bovis]